MSLRCRKLLRYDNCKQDPEELEENRTIIVVIIIIIVVIIIIRPDQINVLGHGSDRPSFFANSKKKKKLPNL